jgi:hypothetical protein
MRPNNLLISLVIIALFALGIYFFLRNKQAQLRATNLEPAQPIFAQQFADDVTGLNLDYVAGIFYPDNIEQIKALVKQAKREGKTITARGQQHTMGGHCIGHAGYILDMKHMNRIIHISDTVLVETGASWTDLIRALNVHGLSVETMQSYSSFSIGGSISVNAHGITNDKALIASVLDLIYVDAQGEVRACSREQNREIFQAMIGGYGLLGIIVQVRLQVAQNTQLNSRVEKLHYSQFQVRYQRNDHNSNDIRLARFNLLNPAQLTLYSFSPIGERVSSTLPAQARELSKLSRLLYKWVFPTKSGQKLQGKFSSSDVPRNVSRNELLYESAITVSQLYNPLIDRQQTHILQEFFIPVTNFEAWMKFLITFIPTVAPGAWSKLLTLLNITLRFVQADRESLLSYAKEDVYAFVFYYRVAKLGGDAALQIINQTLLEKTIELGGSFYLPYRQHYSRKEIEHCYPNFKKFIQLKKRVDPEGLFTNNWWRRYTSSVGSYDR